jgi:hypothetical protein
MTSRPGPHRKHRSSVAVQFFPWKQVCLRGRYSVTAFVYLVIENLLPSSGYCFVVCFEVANQQRLYTPHYFVFTQCAWNNTPGSRIWRNEDRSIAI